MDAKSSQNRMDSATPTDALSASALEARLPPQQPRSREIPSTAPSTRDPKAATSPASPIVDAEQGAALLRDGLCAVFLRSAIDKDVAAPLSIKSFQIYRDALLKDLGGRADPLAVMMAEQLAVAHHIQLRLQVRVGQSTSADECHILSQAAAQMMGEFRRSAVVLRQFQPIASMTDTSAPVASTSTSEQPEVAPADPSDSIQKETSVTEQPSEGVSDDRASSVVPFKESAPRRRRTKKSA